jgi:hypothetical protein
MALAAALLPTAAAAAALQPVGHKVGDLEIPRVRAGTLPIPHGDARRRVTVLVTLDALTSRALRAGSARPGSASTGGRWRPTARGDAGLCGVNWRVAGLARGPHTLAVRVTDATGRTAAAARIVRLCKRA